MRRDQDEIRIDNLEVFARHGVFPEEKKAGQTFYVNLVLYTNTRRAGRQDELSLSTDYGAVCHLVTKWMQEHTCDLIETVAENVAEQILLRYPLVHAVDVEIRKPQAPIGLPFESVSVKIHRGWHRVYIALGSNMGDRKKYLQAGVDAMKKRDDIRLKTVSSWRQTAPYGGVEQEDFLNGVMEVQTLLTPTELLDYLHEVEQSADRKREIHWGPRTLDLDILLYDDLVMESEELIIPHVDMQNRDFVLAPMEEIAGWVRHPILGLTMGQLYAQLTSARGKGKGK
ncbi:MAG: 2-amino-4-hydroxy-6-hydroxymethyldihydropteridine diphosphokinase [Acetatifactor sp.]|nr:2-amino-4-hydroxy-6-hydroxymethyldihydropteridine diphosphokinase [Acetatifactor sp.]